MFLGHGLHLNDCVAVVFVRTRPRAIPLAMITMNNSIHGFSLFFYMGMGFRPCGPSDCWSSANILTCGFEKVRRGIRC